MQEEGVTGRGVDTAVAKAHGPSACFAALHQLVLTAAAEGAAL